MFKKLSIIIMITCVLWGCQDEQPASEPEVKLVKSIHLGDIQSDTVKNYPAVVSANKKVDLAFQVPGQIIDFPVSKGQVVHSGELLAQLDKRDYQHDLDEKIALLEQNKRDYARFQELLVTDSIAQVRVDAKKADYEVAKAQAASAQKALDDTSLRAPFEGIIANTLVENFENVLAKQPILSLQDITSIEFIINVPEQDIFVIQEDIDLKKHQFSSSVGNISFESSPGKKFPVYLKEYATEADPNTQTYEVTLVMENPKRHNVLPGMTATFTPSQENDEKNSYLVPVTAVINDSDSKPYIWIIDDNNQAKKVFVEVGSLKDNYIRIYTDLAKGTLVITAGGHYVEEGMTVRTIQEQ